MSSINSNFQDGQVTVEEFRQAIMKTCTGKTYSEFPKAFKTFIGNTFKTIDVNGMFIFWSGKASETPLHSPFRVTCLYFKLFLSNLFLFYSNEVAYC